MNIVKTVHSMKEQSKKIYYGVITSALLMSSEQARAESISGMFSNLGTATKNFISLTAIVAVGIGVASVLYGLVMMIKKGMGRGDDIEWRQIIWPLIGGAKASVLMYMLYSLVDEVGASRSDLGQGWGG
ncbi:MAG: hypothetical protein P3W87_008655 [Gammaproteobacteria bacterium]|nr:hypothetical protein [Gammaproteobacteria bacterium]